MQSDFIEDKLYKTELIFYFDKSSFFKVGNEIDEFYLNFSKACNYSTKWRIAS